MIVNTIRNNSKNFFSKRIWIVVVIFSILIGYKLQQAKYEDISYFEFILYSLTDHYYILYFMIISYVFLIFGIINDDEEIVIIRSGKYIKYFTSQVISFLYISTLFVLMHVLIVLIIGWGLPFENVFRTKENHFYEFEVLSAYMKYFKEPFSAALLSVIYMILGLAFISMLIKLISHFFHERFAIFSIGVAYFLMLISLRTHIDNEIPFLFLNNYLVLHHSFGALDRYQYLLPMVELLITIFVFWIIKTNWNSKVNFKKIFKFNSTKKWYLLSIFSLKNVIVMSSLIIVKLISILIKYRSLTINDLIVFQFYGHGTGYFSIIDFLSMIVYNGVPLYLLCILLEREHVDRSYFVLIRTQNKKKWFRDIMSTSFFTIFIYVFLSIIIALSLGFLLGLKINDYKYINDIFTGNELNNLNSFYLYMMVLISKVLELFFSFLMIFLFYSYTHNTTLSFLINQSLYIFCFMEGQVVKYIPIGISSISRWYELSGNLNMYYINSIYILISFNIFLYIWLRVSTYKKNFD